MTIRERSMATPRGRMTWLEAGAGWPVVLLHAFPLSAGMWRPQLDRVPEGWRFIAPHYLSSTAVTMDDYAADVLGLLDGLELDTAAIGGLSMGGYVTFAMYRKEPTRFTGMILADTRPQADSPQAREGRVRLREVLAKDGLAGVAGEMLPKLLSESARRDGTGVSHDARAMIEAAAPAAIDAAIGALMARPDSTPGLPAISCATLVIVGDQDEITPLAEAEAMKVVIPRSTLCVIPGAGHLSSLEQPDAFSRALGDFLLAHL
jgi:3-oxoadipate enol-lactonase